ncbi:PREDICTED: uncharacterized protein LOC108758088 [Trachymyrmex cornetzi]|uniref:uncharacterized protein LOC108758088 n=1 Tax=Trachymyrmex cornetzi TaxID=471704 RepID=UPI00084F08DA|nr:PREDICTED: uncharacterized protein LOC108758088 [Trachymyrmex cornetzi]
MLNYSPARAKKLRSDAIPTLYLPLTMIASVPEEVLGSSCDINASTTAEAFHTAVPLPVSVADTCYQEVSPQMFSDASLAAETFPSGVVPLPVSGDASLDTDVVHRALPSNMQDILLENAALKKKLYNLEQRIETEDQRFDRRMHDLLKTIFTPGQIRLLLNPKLKFTNKKSYY